MDDLLNWLLWFLGSAILSNVTYIIAFLAAIFSGIIALKTWKTSSRHNANEHVHKLFSEYLHMRLKRDENSRDMIASEGAHREIITEIDDQIVGFKLYILEEMFIWTELQKVGIGSLNHLFRRKRNIQVKDNVSSWVQTIRVHILQDFVTTKQAITDYACCYSVSFIDFVASVSKDEDLVSLASVHRQAIDQGKARPFGNAEGSLPRLPHKENSN